MPESARGGGSALAAERDDEFTGATDDLLADDGLDENGDVDLGDFGDEDEV